MDEKSVDVRRTLAMNLKKHRGLHGLSQEKLAESAGISVMMIKDIEGCRTWVSDKTLTRLASVLKTDIYRLLMPETLAEDEIYKTVLGDLVNTTDKIRKDIELDLQNILALWHVEQK